MLEKSIITFHDCFTDAPKFVSSSVGFISQRRGSGNSGCLSSHGVNHSLCGRLFVFVRLACLPLISR